MSDFYSSFDAALMEAEWVMGTPWSFNGSEYPAVSAEKITVTDRAMPGGRFADATATLVVRLEVVTRSGVKKGSVIVVDGERLRVIEVDREGDRSRTLICGAVGVEVHRR